MPEQMTRKTRGASSAGRADTLLPFQVRYYSRMYRGGTYPVNIRWKRSERGVAARSVKLRLEVAGAIVVPAEQTIRPADPEDTAKFFVTPIGFGKIQHQVLQVFYNDAKIHEMPLKARVTSQKFTVFLLAFSIFVAWLLLNYCYTPIKIANQGPKESMIRLLNVVKPDMADLHEFAKDWFSLNDAVDHSVEFLGGMYEDLCNACRLYPVLSFTTLSLLVLTLLSLWWHKARRRWRTSVPIELPV